MSLQALAPTYLVSEAYVDHDFNVGLCFPSDTPHPMASSVSHCDISPSDLLYLCFVCLSTHTLPHLTGSTLGARLCICLLSALSPRVYKVVHKVGSRRYLLNEESHEAAVVIPHFPGSQEERLKSAITLNNFAPEPILVSMMLF